jgi:hypothetical protein
MRPDGHHDLLLVLIGEALELKLTAAARAPVGQRNLDLLIHALGYPPARLGPVLLAALAPRPRRITLRLALGERRRLTLRRPARLLQQPTQPSVLRQQTLVLRAQPSPRRTHPSTITTQPRRSTRSGLNTTDRAAATHRPQSFAAQLHNPCKTR